MFIIPAPFYHVFTCLNLSPQQDINWFTVCLFGVKPAVFIFDLAFPFVEDNIDLNEKFNVSINLYVVHK